MARRKPTPKARRTWQRAFLVALANSGNVTDSARIAKIDRTVPYALREQSAEFRRQWEEALEAAADLLELEARRRAHDGVDEPVIHKGQLCGVWVNGQGDKVAEGSTGARFIPLTVKKYSDTLLIFLLKGLRPEKFRERYDHTSGGERLPVLSLEVVQPAPRPESDDA